MQISGSLYQRSPISGAFEGCSIESGSDIRSQYTVDHADKPERAKIFREFGRLVIGKHKERRQMGFNSDPGGEIARGLEQAFQAGRKSAQLEHHSETSKKGAD